MTVVFCSTLFNELRLYMNKIKYFLKYIKVTWMRKAYKEKKLKEDKLET